MNILKVGDSFYSKSLQLEHPSSKLFPQRETWMIKYFKELKLSDSIDCDAIWIDNPMFFTEEVADLDKPVIFDAIDWYVEMAMREGRMDSISRIMDGCIRLKKSKKLTLVSQSPLIESYFGDIVGLKPVTKSIIPNGYSPDMHYPVKGPGSYRLFYAGKLGRWYSDMFYFIEYVKSHPQISLTIAGDGEMRKSFELVSNNSNNITFLGFIKPEEAAKEMRVSDICIFPVNDCSPIAVSEYMACGKPVVNLGTRLSWLVKDKVHGFCLGSPGEIKYALWYSFTHRDVMGGLARERILPYSWENNAKRFEYNVRELLEKCE